MIKKYIHNYNHVFVQVTTGLFFENEKLVVFSESNRLIAELILLRFDWVQQMINLSISNR